MAQLITNKLYYEAGYLDEIMGPYGDLAALQDIDTNRFKGLTVVVLSPIYMECALVAGKTNAAWKVVKMAIVKNGYSQLLEITSAITSEYKNMLEVGFEAVVIENGFPETYVVVSNTSGSIVWQKKESETKISEESNNAITKKEDGIFAALYYETEDK